MIPLKFVDSFWPADTAVSRDWGCPGKGESTIVTNTNGHNKHKANKQQE